MKPETRFKIKCQNDLKELKRVHKRLYFVKIQQVAIRGIPDLLLSVAGRFVAIELKKDQYEKPDPLQQRELEKVEESEGLSFVACPENWKSILSMLELLLKEPFGVGRLSSRKKS